VSACSRVCMRQCTRVVCVQASFRAYIPCVRACERACMCARARSCIRYYFFACLRDRRRDDTTLVAKRCICVIFGIAERYATLHSTTSYSMRSHGGERSGGRGTVQVAWLNMGVRGFRLKTVLHELIKSERRVLGERVLRIQTVALEK
jgi:hypothetical protein